MLKISGNKLVLTFGCILSICTGTLIYALFRENTYISNIIMCFVDLTFLKSIFICLENSFTKYYLPDFLWAFSLSCGLCVILNPKKNIDVFLYSGISFFFGLIYEILQICKVINGTGDIIDIALYFLASLTVSLISLRRV